MGLALEVCALRLQFPLCWEFLKAGGGVGMQAITGRANSSNKV